MKLSTPILVVVAWLFPTGIAVAAGVAASEQVQVTGTRISGAEMAESDPVALVGKRGIMAVLSDGLDNYCAVDTLTVEHDAAAGYRAAGEAIDLDSLIERVRTGGDSLRCLRVAGDRPDRSDIGVLDAQVVKALGMTVLLPPSP